MVRPGAHGAAAAVVRKRSSKDSSDPAHKDEKDMKGWDPARRAVYVVVESHAMKMVTAVVILANTALVVFETDHAAMCEGMQPPPECSQEVVAARIANQIFLSIYATEMVLKMFALRLEYFHCPSDLFDALIVMVGFLGEVLGAMSGVGILRLFRIGRLAKALKASTACSEVKVFISGIGSAFKAIIVGAVLIFFTLFLFAIGAVMLLNPPNQALVKSGFYDDEGCERCKLAYASVSNAMLTLLQIVLMGDNWGDYSVPIIEESPLTALYFICASFTISLGLMNLILAVILDKAIVKLDADEEKECSREVARREFVALCSELDTDQDGHLTIEELLSGYDQNASFQDVLDCLDVDRSDVTLLYSMMDKEKTGMVSYNNFATELQDLRAKDTRTLLSFVKYYVSELHSLQAGLENFLSSSSPEAPRPSLIDEPVASGDANEDRGVAVEEGFASSAITPKGREEKMQGMALASRCEFDRVLGVWTEELCANLESQVKLMLEQMEARFSPMATQPGPSASVAGQQHGDANGDCTVVQGGAASCNSGHLQRMGPGPQHRRQQTPPRMGPGPQLFASAKGELSYGMPVAPASPGDMSGRRDPSQRLHL